jgi:autotransporter-associated beta strand protein
VYKGGVGRLTLGGNNGYTGSTTINLGIIRVQNSNGFGLGPYGSTVVDIVGNSGAGLPAAIELDGSIMVNEGIGTGITVANKQIEIRVPSIQTIATGYLNNYKGMIRSIAGNNYISGKIDVRSYDGATKWAYIGVDSGTLTLGGEISSLDTTGTTYLPGSAIAKAGAGTLVYGHTGSNSYTGSSLVIDGTLRLQSGGSAVNGGTVYLGDNTNGGAADDVLEIGAAEQIVDTVPVTAVKTGNIATVANLDSSSSEEVTHVTLGTGTISSGTWYLVFDPDGTGPVAPQATWGLAYNSTAAQVEAALNALPSVSAADGYVNVVGTLAGTNEVQALVFQDSALPTTGTYTLRFDRDGSGTTYSQQETASINWSDTAATVQSRLTALSSIGSTGVTVTGAYNTGFIITYGGMLWDQDIVDGALTFNAAGMSSSAQVFELTKGGLTTGYNTSQVVYLGSPIPTGGTFSLTFGGYTTANIAYNATAAQVAAALGTLPSIGTGNVQVNGRFDGGFVVTYVGSLQGMNLGTMTANVASLAPTGRTPSSTLVRVGGLDTLMPFDSYYIIWRGSLAGKDVAVSPSAMTGSPYLSVNTTQLGGVSPSIVLSEVTKGGQTVSTVSNETQYISGLTSGTQFTLSYAGYSTPRFNSNTSTTAQIEAALNALPSIAGVGGFVRVSGGGNVAGGSASYYVTFLGGLAGKDLVNIVTSNGTVTESVRGGLDSVETIGAITGMLGEDVSTDIDIAAGTTLTLNANLTYNPFPGSDANAASVPSARIGGAGQLGMLSALHSAGGIRTITLNDGPAADDVVITATLSDGPAGMQAGMQKDGAGVSRMVLNPTSGGNLLTGQVIVNSGFITAESDNALASVRTNEVVRVTPNIPDEQQTITFSAPPTAGTWLLTFNGYTTMPLAWNATAAQVQSALETLPNIGPGNVTVVGAMGSGLLVSFVNGRADYDWPLMTAEYSQLTGSTVTVTETQQGGTAGGSWTISFNGYTTGALPYNATSTEVAAAMNALPSVNLLGGSVRVYAYQATTLATAYLLTYQGGTLGQYNWADTLTTTNTSALTPASNERQSITFSATPATGAFTLSFDIDAAGAGTAPQTTASLAYSATAQQVQSALEALTLIGSGNVKVTGTYNGGGFYVAFTGSLAHTGFSSMLLPSNTTATTMTVSRVTAGGVVGTSTFATVFQGGVRNNTQINNGLTLELDGGVTISDEPISATGVGRLVGPLSYINANVIGTGAIDAVSGDNTIQARAANEQQQIYVGGTPTSGSWSVTLAAATTAALPYNATADDVRNALGALSSVGGIDNVTVTGDMVAGFTVTLVGARARTAFPVMTVASNTLSPATNLAFGETVLGSAGTATMLSIGGSGTLNAAAGASLSVAGSVGQSTNNLFKVGEGVVRITSPSGVNVSYTGTGGTYVNEGTLVLDKPATLTNEVQTLFNALGTTDEQQRIFFSYTTPASGSWSLTFQGQTTTLLAYNADATAVRNALGALASVGGTANVDVQGSIGGGYFTVTFINGLANANLPLITVASNTLNLGTITVAENVAGGIVGTGTYVLTFNGQTTYPLAWNATPAAVQAALESLPTVGAGNIAVSGTAGGDMTFVFQNFLGNADIPQGAAATSLYASIYSTPLAGVVNIYSTEMTKGVGDELQTLTMNANPTAGYYVLTYNSQPSVAIPYNADAATVQAALEGISAIGAGNVQVMGGPLTAISPLTVRFTNGLGQTDVSTLGTAQALLSGAGITATETAKGGYATISTALASGTVFIGDSTGGTSTVQYGPNSSGNAIPDGAAVHVFANGVLDLATNDKSDRIAALWLYVGSSSSAQVATGDGTLALNPTGDTTGYFTLVYTDGGSTWDSATISGNLDLASPQIDRTRRWMKVMDSPADVELDVSANIVGQGGLEKSGQGVLKLSGYNTYTGDTIINEGLVWVASNSAFGSAAYGTTVEWGASVGFVGGINYSVAEPILLASDGSASIIGAAEVAVPAFFSQSGNNSFAGPITLNYGTTFQSLDAGSTFTLSGAMTLNAALTIDGVGDTVLGGDISSGSEDWQAGLVEGRFIAGTSGTGGVFDETFANTGSGGVVLSPRAAETASTPPWGDYMGFVYTGQIYDADGIFTLAENIDDCAEIKIDGITRLRNTASSTPTSTGISGAGDNPYANGSSSFTYGMGPNGDGWHDIEIRVYNGTGGAGAVANNLWSTLKGLGINTGSIVTWYPVQGIAYTIPVDPGDMTLFRCKVSSGNSLTKTGTGTLTLGGDNTYTGETNVVDGELVVDGSTGTGAVTIGTGTELRGTNGTIKGTLTFQDGTLFDPGSDTGTMTLKGNTTFHSGTDYQININGTVAGTEYDQLVENGEIYLNNAKLTVNVGYVSVPADRYVLVDNDGTDAIHGTFNGLANHAIVNIGGENYRIFYDGGTGNDVVLVRAAELAVSTIHYDAGPNGSPSDGVDGTQRSVISRILVTFNGYIDSFDSTGALIVQELVTSSTLEPVNVAYTAEQVGEATQLILTFTGGDGNSYQRPAASGAYSLNDGNFRLTVDSTKVHSNAGDMSAAKVDDFYRWFGDSDGDRDADGTDMFNIRRVLAGDPNYSQYQDAFDYDGNGSVNGTDYSTFRTHYGRRLLPPT